MPDNAASYQDGIWGRLHFYYLSYCEAGFTEWALGDVQMLLAREA